MISILKWRDAFEYIVVGVCSATLVFLSQHLIQKYIPLPVTPPVHIHINDYNDVEEDSNTEQTT